VNYLNIGTTPCEEDCLSVNDPLARAETQIYARQLGREFPAGIFRVKGFQHDFGVYYEVVAMLGQGEESDAAAFEAEAGGNPRWDEKARHERALLGGLEK